MVLANARRWERTCRSTVMDCSDRPCDATVIASQSAMPRSGCLFASGIRFRAGGANVGTAMKRRSELKVLGFVMLLCTAAVLHAQQPVIYPAKGQSAQQQQRDQGECSSWAKQSTGVDPMALAAAPPPQAPSSVGGGERMRGAARGALGGAAIGAIAGDAGQGAGIGAVAGTMAGGRNARQNAAAAQQQQTDARQQQLGTYYRAFGACMEGRGYTVK